MSRIAYVKLALGEDNFARLRNEFPELEFHMVAHEEQDDPELMRQAEIYACYGETYLIRNMVNAKWFHTFSAGIDGFVDEIYERIGQDVIISNSAGVYGIAISEHLLSLMFAIGRGIHESVRNMPSGAWKASRVTMEIFGSTVGILGVGDIGLTLAKSLKGLGANVLGYKLNPCESLPNVDGLYFGDEGLDQMLPQCDYVCVCLPGTPFTKDLIDERRLGLMKQGSAIFNIGRGSIINTEALVHALESGHLTGAGLDVTDPEPLPQDHPLWQMDNVIITPHYAGRCAKDLDRKTEVFAKNIRAYLKGEPLPNLIDRKWRY